MGLHKMAVTGFVLLASTALAASPSVVITGGTVVGTSVSTVDNFMGIPFAQPPVASLRLRPPQPLQTPLGTFQATNPNPTACPQGSSMPNVGEDCLNLNVMRPSGTTASSKLPVVVWFYGGAFIGGSNTATNGTYFVDEGRKLGYPYIWVAMNYRLNGFGFLAGKELQQEGSTNLGLRDQRLALQWVQDNIAAFGGDPAKVTLWGVSAGAISVMDQTIINAGNHSYNGKALFRGLIMNSGTIVPALPVDSSRAQDQFNSMVSQLGCTGSASALACLRAAPYPNFLQAAYNVGASLGYQGIDFVWAPRPDGFSQFFPYSPEDAVVGKKFARVPLIAGDVEDEGTSFVQGFPVQNTSQLIQVLTKHWPASNTQNITTLVSTYPDDPAAGSPFRTGDANNVYPEYKRLAAIYGDALFNLFRRGYLSILSTEVDTYSFLGTMLYGTSLAGTLGTQHGADIAVAGLPNPGLVPRDSQLVYYTSFINFANPNMIPSRFPVWNTWKSNNLQMLNISFSAVTYTVDSYRASSYQAIISILPKLKL